MLLACPAKPTPEPDEAQTSTAKLEAKAPKPLPDFEPNVCQTWLNAPAPSLEWVLGDLQGVDAEGNPGPERLRITRERAWFSLQEADGEGSAGVATPYFHPDEPKLCLFVTSQGFPLPLLIELPHGDPGKAPFDATVGLLSDGFFQVRGEAKPVRMRRITAAGTAREGSPATVSEAIRVGSTRDLKRLVGENPQLDAPLGDDSAQTALELSSEQAQLKMVEYLLAKGANPNFRGSSTPLHAAIEGRDARVVQALLEAGADPLAMLATEAGPRSPLEQASILVLLPQIVKLLIEAIPSFAERTESNVAYSLVNAGREDLLRLMIAKGWTPKHPSGSHSILDQAAKEEHWNIFALLIEAGADVNAGIGYDGEPLLHQAIREQNGELIEALLNAKADVNSRDDRGWTSLWHALEAPELVRRLIEAGGDVRALAKRGETLLPRAVELGHLESAQLLLQAGADPNALSTRGKLPLEMAIEAGNKGLESVLRRFGASTSEHVFR